MSYIIKALLLALAVVAISHLLGSQADERLYHPHFPFVTLFFALSSVAAHEAIVRSLAGNPRRFPAYFMAVSGIKMMVYLVAIGIYVFIRQEEAVPVIVLFMLLYVLYTVLELVTLVPKVSK